MTEAPAPQTTPSRLALAEGLVILGVALWCLLFWARLPGRQVADADFQAAAQVLAAEQQPGDVVLLYPWWTERARLFLPAGLPVVGYLHSDTDNLTTHPRIWVLAQPNQPRSDLDGFLARFGSGRTAEGAPRTFGNLWLQRFTNDRSRPITFDAKAALAQAQVYLETAQGERQPCQWTGRGHRCPNGVDVAMQWHEIDYAPHQCIRLPPPGNGAKLVAEFSAVPAADTLRLEAGYIWEKAAFRGGDTTLTLEVEGQGTPLVLKELDGSLHTVERAGVPEGARVRVTSWAQAPQERDLCFELHGFGRAR